jgi:Rad3-related DNA helicase
VKIKDTQIKFSEEDVVRSFPLKEFRLGQKHAILSILNSHKKFFALQGPTGSGKSVIAYGAAKALQNAGYRSILLTREIFLQKQYSNSFSDVAVIYGRDNYRCTHGVSASEAICRFILTPSQLPCYKDCAYYTALAIARNADIVVSNYHYYFLSMDFIGEQNLGYRNCIVFDEAHNLSEFLASYNAIVIDDSTIEMFNYISRGEGRKKLEKLFGVVGFDPIDLNQIISKVKKGLKKLQGEDDWKRQFYEYHSNYHNELDNALSSVVSYLQSVFEQSLVAKIGVDLSTGEGLTIFNKTIKKMDLTKILEDYKTLRHLDCRLNIITKSLEGDSNKYNFDFIIDYRDDDKFSIIPIDGRNFFFDIFKIAQKVLFMSATLDMENDLGMLNKNCDFYSIPSAFDPKKAPIVYLPIANFVYNNKEKALMEITAATDKILDDFLNIKGIIHTVSYKYTEYLLINSRHKDRFIVPPTGPEKVKVVELFKITKNNKILLSPSIMEGADVSSSQFQIFIKVPWPSLGSKRMKIISRTNQGKYLRETAKSIIQGCGRSVRSVDDSAITFILDAQFGRLEDKLFPDWFNARRNLTHS